MPVVSIKLVGKLSKKQRQEIAKGVTHTLVEVADKKPESVTILFDEMEADCVAIGENLIEDLYKLQKS